MKPVSEWEVQDVLSLPLGEFDFFEAKGRMPLDLSVQGSTVNDLRALLSKQLSAFANSGGGQIVFGLKNPGRDSINWEIDGGGVLLNGPKGNVKEWLEDIIPNLVDFPLRTFNVFAIQGAQTDSGRGLIVIDVADSADAPHMAEDNRYYARIGGKSKPLTNRLVFDIVNRQKHPRLDIEFSIVRRLEKDEDFPFYRIQPEWKSYLQITCTNIGRIYARYVSLKVHHKLYLMPKKERKIRYREQSDQSDWTYTRENTVRDFMGIENMRHQYGPARYVPILPGLSHSWRMELDDTVVCDLQESDVISWELYADNAPALEGTVQLWKLSRSETEEE